MFCKECGAELKEGSAFCSKCGAPVSKQGEAESKAVKAEKQGKTPLKGKAPKDKTAGKGFGRMIPVLAAVLVLAAAGGGAALYFTGDSYQCGKNLKLAEEGYEAGDYKEALVYYKEVIRLDASRSEAYENSADIYMEEGAYEDALKILKQGLKRIETDKERENLTERLLEAYIGKIDTLLAQGSSSQAAEVLKEAWKETGKGEREALERKTGEVYSAVAEALLAQGSSSQAKEALQEGLALAGSAGKPILEVKLAGIYIEQAEALIRAGSYAEAGQLLAGGLEKTGEEGQALLEQKRASLQYLEQAEAFLRGGQPEQAEAALQEGQAKAGLEVPAEMTVRICRAKSDICLAAGNFVSAYQLLKEGETATGDVSLRERAAYIKEHIAVEKQWEIEEADGIALCKDARQYDASGTLREEIRYNIDAMVLFLVTRGDDYHNLTWEGLKSLGAENVISTMYEYNEHGKMTKYIRNRGGAYDVSESIYEEQGGCTESLQYLSESSTLDGLLDDRISRSRFQNVYDSLGRVQIEYVSWNDGYGSEWWDAGRREYEYDERGNVKRVKTYNSDGQLSHTTESAYDEMGNRLYSRTYDENGNLENGYEYEYDETGNTVRYIDQKTETVYQHEWKYDEQENTIKDYQHFTTSEAGVITKSGTRIYEYKCRYTG